MDLAKRLLLFTIFFSVLSFILFAIIPRRLAPEYGILAATAVDFSSPGTPVDSAALHGAVPEHMAETFRRVEYRNGRVPLPLSAVGARQADRIGVVTGEDTFVFQFESYFEIGKTAVAGDHPGTGALNVLDRSGETVEYPEADRAVLFESKVLLLSDGGRRFASVSDGVGPDLRWLSVPAPITAAVPIDDRVIVGDAVGTITAYDDRNMLWRFEMPGSDHPTVLALGTGPELETLYAVGGVEPTSLARFEIDSSQPALAAAEALDEDLRSPIHLLVTQNGPIVASGQSIRIYGTDLEKRASADLDGNVDALGFTEPKKLIYALVSTGDRQRLEFRYTDTLELMYAIDFPEGLHSVQSSGPYYAFGTADAVLIYTELRP